MRIFAFKTKEFREFIPAITYVPCCKSVTVGWLCWYLEFTTDEIYGKSREKDDYIKTIK